MAKGKKMAFNIKIEVPTADKAFAFLAWQVSRLEWYINHNRSNRLTFLKSLHQPLIDKMINDRDLSKDQLFAKYVDRFTKELYNKEAYQGALVCARKAVQALQTCYPRYLALQKSWGFEILPEYQIDINLFGIGGSYHRDENNVGHIMTGDNQKIECPYYARLLGHEIIHLGIEDLLINPEHKDKAPIWQEEKERIVDNLCIYVMRGILPLYHVWSDGQKSPYQEIAQNASYMDQVIGAQPENNLPLAIKAFLSEHHRD